MFWNKKQSEGPPPVLRCSFCKKLQEDVGWLIQGPSVYTCDESVDICGEIIARDEASAQAADVKMADEPPPVAKMSIRASGIPCALCGTPSPVEDASLIANRGLLCAGCVCEIEASLAERRLQDS